MVGILLDRAFGKAIVDALALTDSRVVRLRTDTGAIILAPFHLGVRLFLRNRRNRNCDTTQCK